MEGNAIFPGVYVDGIHVGGMTVDQAKEALAAAHTDTSGLFSITVNIGNKSWVIDSGRVPLTRNYDQILAQAYALGRSNTTASWHWRDSLSGAPQRCSATAGGAGKPEHLHVL